MKIKYSAPFFSCAAFILPIIYWIYLLFTSQTEIKWDSIEYEHLGQMLAHQPWIEYFKTGPNREPLYPFFVSIAIRLSEFINVPYLKMLAFMQFGLLCLTQFLSLKILKLLHVKSYLITFIVFYIGISPVLVNCALSLYSEILIIPLIPASILIFGYIFGHLAEFKKHQIFLYGIIIGGTLIILTFVKGIFEIAGPAVIISSFFIYRRLIINPQTLKNYCSLLLVACVSFLLLMHVYKTTNETFNGNYSFTNRGAWAFYGFAARRVEHLNTERFLAGMAYIPGEGVCKNLFPDNEEPCRFWSFYTSDGFGMTKLKELIGQGYTGAQLDQKLMHLATEKIKAAPFQYTFLTFMEGFKIFFWESTKLGFVIYPSWLSEFYDLSLFKNILRLFWAGCSVVGLLYSFQILFFNQNNTFSEKQYITIFFIVSLVVIYTSLYSFFVLGTRYAVPTAPLLLILFAVLLSQRIKRPYQ